MASTPSTVARFALARRNQDLVMAEGSLLGERRVAIVRVVLILARAILFGPLEAQHRHAPPDPVVLAVSGVYLVLALGILYGVWFRARPNVRLAWSIPFVIMALDYGYIVFMALWGLHVHVPPRHELGAIAFGILILFSLTQLSWVHQVVSTLLAVACYLGISLRMGQLDAASTTFVVVGFVGEGLLVLLMHQHVRRMFVDLRRRDNLTKFLPPAVAEQVMALGDEALAPVQREVTVLFTDIRGFTSYSESLPPRVVLEFIDGYFGHMAHIIKAHHGIVNKFLGDGLLAVWGVPHADPDHARNALKAALDVRQKVAEMNADRAARGELPFRIGMGLHSGPVAAGMVGGADLHEYTVIGDAVNLASRIEGLTKELGVDLLVSQQTWSRVEPHFEGCLRGEERVKGRQESVVVYAVEAVRPRPRDG